MAARLDVTATGPAPAGGWTKFQLEPCPSDSSCQATQTCIKTADTTNCLLDNLLPNTQYTVKVTALNADGSKSSQTRNVELKTLLT